LARAREQKISELSQYFANDDLSLDELERRIERVYRAANVLELDEITADLQGVGTGQTNAATTAAARTTSRGIAPLTAPAEARMLAIMGETRRLGRWQVPQQLNVLSIMSDTKLDLTRAIVSPGTTEIHIRAVWSACKIIVPPGMRVINEMHAIMASVTSKAHEMDPPGAQRGGPVIRLTGTALMAEVKVRVRRVEGADDDDEDEDDER
jgi:hypothetical protein